MALWLLEAKAFLDDDRAVEAREAKFLLRPGTYTVGRAGAQADIDVVDDGSISRKHAEILVPPLGHLQEGEAPYILLKDCSRNGTQAGRTNELKEDHYMKEARVHDRWYVKFGHRSPFRLYLQDTHVHILPAPAAPPAGTLSPEAAREAAAAAGLREVADLRQEGQPGATLVVSLSPEAELGSEALLALLQGHPAVHAGWLQRWGEQRVWKNSRPEEGQFPVQLRRPDPPSLGGGGGGVSRAGRHAAAGGAKADGVLVGWEEMQASLGTLKRQQFLKQKTFVWQVERQDPCLEASVELLGGRNQTAAVDGACKTGSGLVLVRPSPDAPPTAGLAHLPWTSPQLLLAAIVAGSLEGAIHPGEQSDKTPSSAKAGGRGRGRRAGASSPVKSPPPSTASRRRTRAQAAASNGSDTDATEDSAEPPRTRQRLIPEDDDAPRTLIPQAPSQAVAPKPQQARQAQQEQEQEQQEQQHQQPEEEQETLPLPSKKKSAASGRGGRRQGQGAAGPAAAQPGKATPAQGRKRKAAAAEEAEEAEPAAAKPAPPPQQQQQQQLKGKGAGLSRGVAAAVVADSESEDDLPTKRRRALPAPAAAAGTPAGGAAAAAAQPSAAPAAAAPAAAAPAAAAAAPPLPTGEGWHQRGPNKPEEPEPQASEGQASAAQLPAGRRQAAAAAAAATPAAPATTGRKRGRRQALGTAAAAEEEEAAPAGGRAQQAEQAQQAQQEGGDAAAAAAEEEEEEEEMGENGAHGATLYAALVVQHPGTSAPLQVSAAYSGSNFKAFRRKGGSSTSVDASSGLLAPPAIVPLDPEPYQEAKIDTEAFLKAEKERRKRTAAAEELFSATLKARKAAPLPSVDEEVSPGGGRGRGRAAGARGRGGRGSKPAATGQPAISSFLPPASAQRGRGRGRGRGKS